MDATADAKPKTDAGNDVVVLGDSSPPDTGSNDAGVDAPDPDLGCLTDDAGCINCCFNNHPDGAATYFDTLTNCACKTGATCHSASVCSEQPLQGTQSEPDVRQVPVEPRRG